MSNWEWTRTCHQLETDFCSYFSKFQFAWKDFSAGFEFHRNENKVNRNHQHRQRMNKTKSEQCEIWFRFFVCNSKFCEIFTFSFTEMNRKTQIFARILILIYSKNLDNMTSICLFIISLLLYSNIRLFTLKNKSYLNIEIAKEKLRFCF